ncbi:hypothetical protein BD779DRAFT_1147651 [Infundibulicybe gibba]|nr:hypothetical protein BD779DRAFT_1147651 [Infundibulicybe gibba]
MVLMNSLPTEIIQTIFLQLCSPKTMFPLCPSEPRLLVTSICSQWRAIALSTRALWTDFSIAVRDPRRALQPSPILTWISRTGQSTLSFHLRSPVSSVILDIVFTVIHRCSILDLHLNIATLNRFIMLPPNSLCALQSITLFALDSIQVTGPTPIVTAFQSCPKLHTFVLRNPRSTRSPGNLTIGNFDTPWQQLTILQFHTRAFAYECLEIVRRCTSLQKCNVSISDMDDLALQRIIGLSRCPVVLPSLHTLRIEFPDSENDNFMFLHALRLPSLWKFQPVLLGLSEETVHSAPWSLSVLQSVLCDTIQELDLSELPVHENLSEVLVRLPNLKVLWLGGDSSEYPGIMHALGEGTIGPRLTTLYLHYVENLDFLFDALEARVITAHASSGITALANVMILGEDDDLTDEGRLLAFAETGMRIRFGCTSFMRF